ncbi:DGQHR domain-containing protein [Pandoraea pnomenusa]|uniref:DGQHR domain-containing protein n=1 Tax=Pandoraea pnomenusa TaxID=93220 RepID=UPI002432FBB0|nr:DGQHR domain-containing protein [Pandoraea pnomenusa]
MKNSVRIPALRVKQWLDTWNAAEWSNNLPEPAPHFFIASISLSTLRRLAGVSKRQVADRRTGGQGQGYQRAHQPQRSRSIARYLKYGFPISNESKLNVSEYTHLIHPGWLPTSILVNVVGAQETRRRSGQDRSVDANCVVSLDEDKGHFFLTIPAEAESPEFSLPTSSLEPLEIIDGQHRLFAIDELNGDVDLDDYEVPVVLFDGLTPSWQAYLFWVINVEPKKINPSLAYDLYPELRNQSWLQAGEGIRVYQEHRAQELTEVLWRHEQSPWKDRIELHGQRVEGHVSNAAFIRSLMVSFVRQWGKQNRIGGLFGSLGANGEERVLPWKRSQQAAFLIACWRNVSDAVDASEAPWVKALAKYPRIPTSDPSESHHSAFAGPHTLLGTDQGARAVLVVFNALCQIAHATLELEQWESDRVSDMPEDDDVSDALEELSKIRKINTFLAATARSIVSSVDWRTSSAPGLNEAQKNLQAVYRGSSGYALLQSRCFDQLKQSDDERVAEAARLAAELLGR